MNEMRERGSDQIGPGQGQVEGHCEHSKECVNPGLRRDVDETCDLLGGYTACSVIPYRRLRTIYRSHLQESDLLSRKVGKETLHAAQQPRRAQISQQ
jgi:hypothetical protein